MKKLKSYFIVCVLLISSLTRAQQNLYFTDNGTIDFTSDAPLEVIKAASGRLSGILNIEDRSFSFSIPMKSFEGFNSALQRTHFNENYIESDKFPNSKFNGKVIEEIDFTIPGEHRIRAKGKMIIHGIEQDRIIRCNISIKNNEIKINADFTVLLADHDIKIPSIVQHKLAEEISVRMGATMTPMK